MIFMKLASPNLLGARLFGARLFGARLLGIGLVIMMPKLAFAHLGHIGDLAGHGHLIGVAGLAAAGAGAVLWGVLRGGKNEAGDNTDEVIEKASAGVDAGVDADVGADAVPEKSA
jgi:hypothetical protein